MEIYNYYYKFCENNKTWSQHNWVKKLPQLYKNLTKQQQSINKQLNNA